jgi:hypothetical protein
MRKRPGTALRATRWFCIVGALALSPCVPADTPIYRCVVNGVTTFSDRACGQSVTPVTLDDSRISTFTPVPSAMIAPGKQAKRRARPAGNSDQTERKNACASIRSSLKKVDDQMRSGYSAKEGVRLDARKRDLRQRERALKC